jgi:PPOX class probable F420-dependent enzyme
MIGQTLMYIATKSIIKAAMIFKSFEKQYYLTIETFRKNGQGVKTPVWFIQEGESLYVWTQTRTGKVKRLRNNRNVRIVPSTILGNPLGEWRAAYVTISETPEVVKHVIDLMKKKYGILFYIFSFLGGLHNNLDYTALKIQPQPPSIA